MHILSAILAIPKVQFFLATNLLLQTVAAIHPEFHLLFKRQGCYRIESECLTVGSDPRECINYICDNCAALDDAISTCCQLTGDLNKAQCMSDNIDTDSPSNSDDDDSDSDSDSPSLTASSGSSGTASPNAGCSSLADILTSCDSATPGFEYITAWRGLASCYCYSASAFAPQSFDNPYSSCLSYLETADTELYSSLTVGIEVSTPCASIGNVLAESTGEAETTVSRTARPGPTPTTGGGSGPTATSGSSGGSSGDNEETSGASDSPGPGVGDSPVGASGHIGIPFAIAIVTSIFALAILL